VKIILKTHSYIYDHNRGFS